MSDLRDAGRALRATPIVTAVAILSLALGIGANTAIFSIIDSLLLRSLPVRAPERLALVKQRPTDLYGSWTNPFWEQIRDRRRQIFETAFAFSSTRFDLASGGEADYVQGLWVSGDFFDGLGVQALLGRTLTDADDRRGGGPDGPVAVISYSYWQRRFGGAADALGKTIQLDRVPFTIVGVTPPGFFGPEVGRRFEVAIPIGAEPLVRGRDTALDKRSTWWLRVMVRLKDGQTLAAAEQALRGVQPQVREATIPQGWRPDNVARYLATPLVLHPASSGVSGLRQTYTQPIVAIMAVVVFVLLIACANIANLLLARAAARRHEFSVRLALGASRIRLARQLLVESLLLSGLGALLGLALARWGSGLLVRQLSTESRQVFLNVSIEWRVLAFTIAVAVATALLFGLVPALRASRAQPIDAIREHGRGAIGERRVSLGHVLVAGQIALSLVLIVGAGLFMRTFASLATLDLGFDRDPLLIVQVNAQKSHLAPDQRRDFYQRLADEVRTVPGVSAAVASLVTPVSGDTWNDNVVVENRPPLSGEAALSNANFVTPHWFAAYGTRLKAGRDIDVRDTLASTPIVVVNETFVRRFLGGGQAIGQRVRLPGGLKDTSPWMEIVGVVADAIYLSPREAIPPTMYMPLAQRPELPSFVSVTVRVASGAPMLAVRGVAEAIGRVDRDLALTFTPLRQNVDAALAQERMVAMLSGFFGALALLLAGLGLYGVMSYAVNRRRGEIGIRMALGASAGHVIGMILGRVGLLVSAGVIVGAGVAWWASRFVETLLWGLKPQDLTTLIGASFVLATVGALAGWLPARRAARIDPARVLRDE
jgi:predicted permease